MEKLTNILLVNRGIILEDDHMLLIQRAPTDSYNAGLWEFPGGKVDEGEDILTALSREVHEETGIVIERHSNLIHVDSEVIQTGRNSGRLYVALFHVVRRLSGDLALSDEHVASSWDTVDMALKQQMTPESRRALGAFSKS